MPIVKGYKALVDEAMAQVKTYSVAQVRARLEEGSMQLIDIRDIRELQADGSVPGAYHAPRCMLEFWVDPESPYHKKLFADESRELVLFCGLGWRSALATKTLQDMGLQNVAHIDGGFTEWQKQGAPVQSWEQRKSAAAKA